MMENFGYRLRIQLVARESLVGGKKTDPQLTLSRSAGSIRER